MGRFHKGQFSRWQLSKGGEPFVNLLCKQYREALNILFFQIFILNYF